MKFPSVQILINFTPHAALKSVRSLVVAMVIIMFAGGVARAID